MCIAAPCDIFFPAGVYTTFKCTSTLVANDSARERVAVLIFLVLLFYAFFFAALFQDQMCGIIILTAYNRLMVVTNQVLLAFSAVYKPVELTVTLSLLKDSIANVFLIANHPSDGGRGPTAAVFTLKPSGVEVLSNHMSAFAGQDL